MSESNTAGTEAAKLNGAAALGRRTFSTEFKQAAVDRLAKESVAEVCKSLGLVDSVLRRWAKEKPKKAGKNTTYSYDFKRRAVARLLAGESAANICSDLKIHNSMVYAWRDMLAKEKPGEKPAPRVGGAAVSKFSDAMKLAAIARLNAGETGSALGRELGVSPSTVGYWRQHPPQPGTKAAGSTTATMGAIGVKDAISFLKHAKTEIHSMLQRGEIKEMDQAHLLSQLALNALLRGA